MQFTVILLLQSYKRKGSSDKHTIMFTAPHMNDYHMVFIYLMFTVYIVIQILN